MTRGTNVSFQLNFDQLSVLTKILGHLSVVS